MPWGGEARRPETRGLLITTRVPGHWRDLQNEVASILSQCGFEVEVEMRRETVRGTVEFDVYAHEEVQGRRYSLACECKHWQTAVPQSIVHGFRTVLADIGANVGYIVSSAGYQSGAFTAAELTNTKLLTWEQFQEEFEETWYARWFSPQMAEQLDPLLTYTEPLLPAWFGDLSEDDKQEYLRLKDQFDELGWLIMAFTPYVRMLHEIPLPELPVIGRIPEDSRLRRHVPEDILNAQAYRDFFERVVPFGQGVIDRFRQVRATVVADESPHE